MNDYNVDEWMDGGGIPSASFNGPPPITWAGTITDAPSLEPQRDFDDGTPLTWPDGRPKTMLKVIVQTDVRDPQNPDDDGRRALYLKYKSKDAVQEAIKRAGLKGAPKKGGWLSLTYTSDDVAARKGKNAPPKNYAAEYRPPDPWAGEEAAQAPQGAPQGQGWGAMPPPPPQGQQPPAGPPQGYNQQPQGPVGQQYIPPQQPAATAAPTGAPGAPAATTDPLVDFLTPRGIDVNSMPREMAVNIARQLGYQGN